MNRFLLTVFATVVSLFSAFSNAAFVLYEYSGGIEQFVVPTGVNSINVLVVGAGGGGGSGHHGGGGSGEVVTGTFAVTGGDTLSLFVGQGGSGAETIVGSSDLIGISAGEDSFFDFLVAGGGGFDNRNIGGHDGGSGGGGACNSGTLGGSGGSGGSDGQACQVGPGFVAIGLGQGDFTALLTSFDDNLLSAGAGGAGGTGTHAGGGGAGGVQINGLGENGQDGVNAIFGAKGGSGYGAGGGGGSINGTPTRFGGGDGANGLVYIEYTAVPLPAGAWLFLSALAGLVGIRIKRG